MVGNLKNVKFLFSIENSKHLNSGYWYSLILLERINEDLIRMQMNSIFSLTAKCFATTQNFKISTDCNKHIKNSVSWNGFCCFTSSSGE